MYGDRRVATHLPPRPPVLQSADPRGVPPPGIVVLVAVRCVVHGRPRDRESIHQPVWASVAPLNHLVRRIRIGQLTQRRDIARRHVEHAAHVDLRHPRAHRRRKLFTGRTDARVTDHPRAPLGGNRIGQRRQQRLAETATAVPRVDEDVDPRNIEVLHLRQLVGHRTHDLAAIDPEEATSLHRHVVLQIGTRLHLADRVDARKLLPPELRAKPVPRAQMLLRRGQREGDHVHPVIMDT